MPTLNLKQITDKLNVEFIGDTRKIVFWYDDAGEFADEIGSLEIIGAKIHKLTGSNQFCTKHLLERQDVDSSYLVYAPFEKPEVRENVLEDILLYSRRFYADRASLLVVDLQVDERLKPIFHKHSKFFNSQQRTQRFYDFEAELSTDEAVEVTIMSSLCKTRTASFEEVLRVVLTSGNLEENQYLVDFEKHDLFNSFWKMCEDSIGYCEPSPTLLRLATTMFATYAARQLKNEVPKAWSSFVSTKSGSIIAFLDSLMNSVVYGEHYDELAKQISAVLNVSETIKSIGIGAIIDVDAFSEVDEVILNWIVERLLDEDIGATSGDMGITELCKLRVKKHFGSRYRLHYELLLAAFELVRNVQYKSPESFEEIVKQYVSSDYTLDRWYRFFYCALDNMINYERYEELRQRVENIYTNKYLSVLLPAFNASIDVKLIMSNENAQLNFFKRNVMTAKDKTVIIISDAMRYEVGQELFQKLTDDPNCNAEISHMIGVLPANTALGMAALLPHKELKLLPDGKVNIDDKQSDSTEKRRAILNSALPNSRCIRAEDVPIKRDELREIFTAVDVVYIYHNQIDNRGESSENEVFAACKVAVNEIFALIKRLSVNNVYRFIVTADHGFLYKRDKFSESEKINLSKYEPTITNRRYVIGDKPVKEHGVISKPLCDIVGGGDKRHISWPIGATVFKVHGGLNYVHGAASPQEVIIPLITVKTEKGHVDTKKVEIALVSMVRKITNLIVPLDFIQKEPVCDVVTAAKYRIYFVSDDGEKITNEQIYEADRKDEDPSKRMFRLKFNFKNKKYDSKADYWLVAEQEKSKVVLFRHQVIVDIAFADGNGFGF